MWQTNKIDAFKVNYRCWAILLCLFFIQNLDAQTRSLTTILESLSKEYEVFFSYDADLLSEEQVVFAPKEKETAEVAIERLLTKVGLSYDRFEEKYYVIYQKGYEKPSNYRTQKKAIKKPKSKKKSQKIWSSILIDGEENSPISDAFIFIRNSSISTTSDLSGFFQLAVGNFSRGELVITHLNYQTQTFSLADRTGLPKEIRLTPKNLAFAEVKVKAKRMKSKKRKQWLKQFTTALFGEGNNKRGMKLLNPEAVWFQEKDGVLLAEAVNYLSIYNPSLGYQLRFYLESFRTEGEQTEYIGKVYFEDKKIPLAIKNHRNVLRIERKRKKTYQRSKKYFFRSLLAGDLDTEQFPYGEAILDDNRKVIYFNPLTLDSLTFKRGQFQDTLLTENFFAFSNKKIVAEWGRSSTLNNYATCFLHAKNGQIILDHSGEILNPKEIVEVGYWTGRRLADLMPMEYNFTRPIVVEKEAEDIVSELASKINQLPQEKVYLHLNKPFYSLTESIWFKAYLLNAHNHSDKTLSKVVYVDLIDPVGEITKSWTLHKDKVMDGDFRFNSLHQPGQYQIRAYTQYMRNEVPEFFFQKSFWVYDYSIKEKSVVVETSLLKEKTLIQANFFPEGGDLIDGLSNNIAFKITDLTGQPITTNGVITDENGQLVTKIKTQHEGLGLFNLIPQKGTTYKAKIDYKGTSVTFDLPTSQREGLVMRVNNRDSAKLFIDIQATKNDLLDGIYLIGHVRGQIFCFLEEINSEVPIVFTKAALPTGVAHFTLFNAKHQPISERLIFNEIGMEKSLLTLETNKKNYRPREKIELAFSAHQIATDANLSLTVTDRSIVNYSANSETLPSYVLLNSDLTKAIPNANFYLQSMDKSKRYWLDLYLMTYGWRRFKWKDLLKMEKEPIVFLPETGYSLKGYTTERKRPDKRLPTQVMLTSLDSNFIYETQTTDKAGNFHFQNLPYLDSITFIIQGRVQNRKNRVDATTEEVKMEGERLIDFHFESIEKPAIQPLKSQLKTKLDKNSLAEYLTYEQQSSFLDSIYKSIWKIDFEQEVVVKAKRKAPYKFGNGYDFNQMDWLHPQKNGTSLLSYLYPRLNYATDFQTGKLYLVRGRIKTPVSISINGFGADIQGSNAARFLSLNVDMIDYLYFKNAVLMVITRTIPRSLQIKLESGVLNVDHPGYVKAREFYAPNYAQNLPIHHIPDLRTAIHWVPNIQVTKDQPTELSFYAADTPTTYELRVEGITTDGQPIFEVMSLEVEH